MRGETILPTIAFSRLEDLDSSIESFSTLLYVLLEKTHSRRIQPESFLADLAISTPCYTMFPTLFHPASNWIKISKIRRLLLALLSYHKYKQKHFPSLEVYLLSYSRYSVYSGSKSSKSSKLISNSKMIKLLFVATRRIHNAWFVLPLSCILNLESRISNLDSLLLL